MSVSPQSNKSLFTNERAHTHTRVHTFEYKYLRGSTERRVNKYYICRCLSHNIIYSLVCARSFWLDRMYSNKINLAGAKAHHHPSTLPTAMSTINCHFIMSNIITPTPPPHPPPVGQSGYCVRRATCESIKLFNGTASIIQSLATMSPPLCHAKHSHTQWPNTAVVADAAADADDDDEDTTAGSKGDVDGLLCVGCLVCMYLKK